MAIKLIAVDLDDTLLRNDWTLSPRNKAAIQKAQAQGVRVTLATGRMAVSARRYAEELGMDIPIITYQGALIQQVLSGEVLFHRVIPKDLAVELVTPLIAEGVHCQIYLRDRVFAQEYNDWAAMYSKAIGVPVEEADLLKVLEGEQEGVEKILLMGQEEELKRRAGFLRKHYGDRIHVTTSKTTFLEMVDVTVNKGMALKALAELYHIKPEEVMAIGDSYNDIEMLKFAGLGVAMGNAREEVKRIADVITGTNEEDGVAQAIEKWVLGIR